MIDIHSHILPEVDDGACSWEVAIHMCHMAAQDGITHMVATPHANHEYVFDRGYLENVLTELRNRIGPEMTFSLGCDFHFSYENLAALEQDPRKFTIASTRYLLVELSDFSLPPSVTAKLDGLLMSGLRPIITHPERNPLLQAKPGQVVEWARMGCPVQITANALTDNWGDKAVMACHYLLRHEAVHIVASDCHNVESRPPLLSNAVTILEKNYGNAVAIALSTTNPQAVLDNRELPFFPRSPRNHPASSQ